jgi:hypothetical protein
MKTLDIGKSKWSGLSHHQARLGTVFLAICLLSSLPAGAAERQDDNIGGTSCATPLWAAFTALVNQQAANQGLSSVGFLNPAL